MFNNSRIDLQNGTFFSEGNTSVLWNNTTNESSYIEEYFDIDEMSNLLSGNFLQIFEVYKQIAIFYYLLPWRLKDYI